MCQTEKQFKENPAEWRFHPIPAVMFDALFGVIYGLTDLLLLILVRKEKK